MVPKKNFPWSKQHYYFTIKSIPNNITINRSTKKAAVESFLKYKAVGKDIEWLGRWTGKKFTENTVPNEALLEELQNEA